MTCFRALAVGTAMLSLAGRGAAAQCIAGTSPGFDFTPGARVLFATDFSQDKLGDFPAGLEFKTGAMEVSLWDGKPALKASAPSALLIPLAETLPDQFTVEVGVVNRNTKQVGAHTLKIYGGRIPLSDFATGATRVNVGTVFWEVTGGGTKAEAFMPEGTDDTCVGQFMNIRLSVEGPKLKVYADDKRIASIPNAQFLRAKGIVLALEGRDDADNAVYVTGIRIAAGNAAPSSVTTNLSTTRSQPAAQPAPNLPITVRPAPSAQPAAQPGPTATVPTPTTTAPASAIPTTPAPTATTTTGATPTTTASTTAARPRTTTPTTPGDRVSNTPAASLVAPVGVTAAYVGGGRFAFAWAPVAGATEYELYLKTAACPDCRISIAPVTDTTYVPQNIFDYQGAMSVHVRALDGNGAVSPNSAPIALMTPPRHWGAYRITISGVRVNRETFDDPAQIDGKRDEIMVRAAIQAYDAEGTPSGESGQVESKVHGDINHPNWSTPTHPQLRINAGSASSLGGLKTGDVATGSTVPTSFTFPLLVWEGILREGGVTVAIAPSVWEVDRRPTWQDTTPTNPGRALLTAVGGYAAARVQFIAARRDSITAMGLNILRQLAGPSYANIPGWALGAALETGTLVPLPLLRIYNVHPDTLAAIVSERTAQFESLLQNLGGTLMSKPAPLTSAIRDGLFRFYNNWSPTLAVLLNNRDRPIGVTAASGQPTFVPQLIKLDFESIEGLLAAGALSSAGPGVFEVHYKDQIAGGGGDYTIFLKVERMN